MYSAHKKIAMKCIYILNAKHKTKSWLFGICWSKCYTGSQSANINGDYINTFIPWDICVLQTLNS